MAGTAPRSLRAVESVRRICEAHLAGRYELEIVDIYQQPEFAERDRILAAPILLRIAPLPERRIAGDLLDAERVLVGLNIQPAAEAQR
ncbi:circadian clock KaiB family protein [Methylobacterium sp. SI9]|uniref:circadian clock KaiB family protein n=1 Tax=Methylobacterium guangdongense TaxID=3138811 RepID=UPI00313B53C2